MHNGKPTLRALGIGTQKRWSEPAQVGPSCYSIIRGLDKWLIQGQGESRERNKSQGGSSRKVWLMRKINSLGSEFQQKKTHNNGPSNKPAKAALNDAC